MQSETNDIHFLSDRPIETDEISQTKFGHEGIAETIKNIIISCPTRFTIGLFGRWGSGKTTILRILAGFDSDFDGSLEYSPNSDNSEWTFKIRKGVVFHDGTPLTADDVVWSMNRHLTEDSTSVIKSVLATVKEWKKVGTHEVKATMHSPNADLPTLLGMFQNKVVKNGTKGDWIGTGPYTMESFEPGVKSVHKRNQNYWREGANLDAIEITAITDPVARTNAVISTESSMPVSSS